MRSSKGIITVAKLSGAPVIPASYATTNGPILHSWDRFLLAWPFSKGVIIWGSPIEVPGGADTEAMEKARQSVEESLNSITAEADRLTDRELLEATPHCTAR